MGLILAPIRDVEQLEKIRCLLVEQKKNKDNCLVVCGDTGCTVWGSQKVKDVFVEALKRQKLSGEVSVRVTGCLGLCESGPVVIVYPGEIFYQKVTVGDVDEIIEKTVRRGEVVERLLYVDPSSGEPYHCASEIPFYKRQQRQLLGANWHLQPTEITDYLAVEGYSALAMAIRSMEPLSVIQEIIDSRLRGRGGAGFPTGIKWKECYEAPETEKYIICNADEGDPGAFMDRSLLEGNPHSVLEGLIIGGFAVGARHGIVYIREEYPTAVEKIKRAIKEMSSLGLLGENILDSGFDFEITVSSGAGAFVCGETSALVNSVEGKVGEPRQKPPHLAEQGLYNKPTVINNVETLANIPLIIREGAAKYCLTGTEKSKGTKIFSLVGKVNNTGLVEVPLGMTLREIIFDIGGGIKGDKKFKAVQTGGPSGGCLPEELLDLPTDFDDLNEAGSMMGSGGMIVLSEDSCMVDLARYFLSFLKDESCGKCFSCREGISRMLEIVEDFTLGCGTLEQLDLLQELAQVVKDASMCGLGQSAPNPVLSTIRYFNDEIKAHIVDRKCPAGVCQALINFSINKELCNGCGACLKSCPVGAVRGEKKQPHSIISVDCNRCGICLETCRYNAVIKH